MFSIFQLNWASTKTSSDNEKKNPLEKHSIWMNSTEEKKNDEIEEKIHHISRDWNLFIC